MTAGPDVSAAGGTECSPQSFGAVKKHVFQTVDKRFFAPPEEIASITRGVYREFVGLFVNDGIARWIGVDVDRADLIEVASFAGPRLSSAPSVTSPTQDHYRRERKDDRVHIVYVVRKRKLTDKELCDVIREANGVWAFEPQEQRIPMPRITDIHDMLLLIDGKAMKTYGGPGTDMEEGKRLHELLYTLRRSAWGDGQ